MAGPQVKPPSPRIENPVNLSSPKPQNEREVEFDLMKCTSSCHGRGVSYLGPVPVVYLGSKWCRDVVSFMNRRDADGKGEKLKHFEQEETVLASLSAKIMTFSRFRSYGCEIWSGRVSY